MRSKLKKTNSEGFTIIEIMIVLVIAGLILLIVFLAVPALQRNARNTSRKSDASAVIGAVNEFIDNNNGTAPSTAAADTTNTGGLLTLGVGQSGVSTTESKVGYYNVSQGTANGDVNVTSGALTYSATATTDYLEIVESAVCGVAATTKGVSTYTVLAGSARSFVAVYEIENGNNSYQAVCTSS